MPELRILYFAQVRDRLGCEHEAVALPPACDAAGILSAVAARHPAHAALIARCRVAVDQQFIIQAVALGGSSEIALIPPVSGG